MSQTIILYLGSLAVRSAVVASAAGLCTWRMRSVARRHAVWAAVLAIMLLLPLADQFVPPLRFSTSVATLPTPDRYVSPFDPNVSMPTQSLPLLVEPAAHQERTLPSLWNIVGLASGLVTLVLAVQIIRAHRRLQAIRRRSCSIATPAFPLAHTCGIVESDEVALPITIGWLRPIIILPSSWTTWDTWTLRAVLQHESAHVRRRDWAIAMVAAINTVVFWYNPLSWWLEQRLAALCEEACDEASVSALGDATRYSEVLLQFATAHVGSRLLRASGVAMARQNVASRIERILTMERPESGVLTKVSFIGVCAVAAPMLCVAAAIHSGAVTAVPQVASTVPSFEVASVKPSGGGGGYSLGDCRGSDSKIGDFSPALGRCVYRNISLKGLISAAYSPASFGGRLGFPGNQIEQSNGLDWITSQTFDIEAKAENPSTVTEQQLLQMLQQLLAERFQLKLHRETRETAGYLLQVLPSGIKLSRSTGRETHAGMGGGPPSGGFMAGEAVPVSAIVTFLSNRLGRPIEDRTGLMGLYNWELRWAPDDSEFRPDGVPVKSEPANPGPSFITAVQEQLGLRLESTRLNIEILHVDHAEKPMPNGGLDVATLDPGASKTFPSRLDRNASSAQLLGRRSPIVRAASVTQAVAPRFEEASIKPCDEAGVPPVPAGARGGGMNSFRMTPGRTHVLCMTLGTLIRTAYGYGPANLEFLTGGGIGPRGERLQIGPSYGLGVENGMRVKGGPSWVRSDRYSIEAVAAGEPDGPTMSGPMLRELLERRFQLTVHTETVQVPAYSLVVAKGGLKIKPMPEGGCTPRPPATPGVPRQPLPPAPADKPYCGANGTRNGLNTVITIGGMELSSLPEMLGISLGGTRILDKTGISDKFNFVFEFAVDENATEAPAPLGPPSGEPPDIPLTSNIVSALEKQLGLSLIKDKAPRDVIVIDRVERPTPN
jgi:bla regulator protein BlaR1